MLKVLENEAKDLALRLYNNKLESEALNKRLLEISLQLNTINQFESLPNEAEQQVPDLESDQVN